jgi:hypothetical protein
MVYPNSMASFDLAWNSPWWFVGITFLCALAAAVWYYRVTRPQIQTGLRAVLVALRTLGLVLLLLVLFEPVLTLLRSFAQEPKVRVLLDQSISMVQRDASRDRNSDLRALIAESPWRSVEGGQSMLGFDESVRPLNAGDPSQLVWKGQRTDIERALRYVQEHAETENTQAVVLISDGAYTAGANPIAMAEQLGVPLYVIGIGDSARAKDVSVSSLVTNDVGFLNTVLPVQVSVRTHGFEGTPLRLRLLDNNVQTDVAQLNIRQLGDVITHVFQYKATTAGVHKLSAVIEGVPGELTAANNSVSDFVTIRDDKRNVVLIAGAPSPDVAFIRSSIEAMQGVSLSTIIQKSGAEVYNEASTQSTLRGADLIVMVGFPVSSTSGTLVRQVAAEITRSKKPLLFVASQNLDYSKLREFDAVLPFSVQSSRQQEFSVTMDVAAGEEANALLRLSGSAEDADVWNSLPPIFRTETFLRVKPESRVVASIKVNNVSLDEPLIVTRNVDRSKCVAVLGYGLFRWKLLGTALEKMRGSGTVTDALSVLLSNSTKWLSTDDDQRKVRIRPSRSFYAGSEAVYLQAQVYNDAMVPEENATVTVNIASGNQQRTVVLQSLGNGQYGSSIDGLGSGDYSYTGTAVAESRPLGKDAGRFTIGDLPLEYQDLRMNVALLRAMAERSGGRFYTPQSASSLADDISAHRGFRERVQTSTVEWNLSSMAQILAAALLCFALEWFVRKRTGMI